MGIENGKFSHASRYGYFELGYQIGTPDILLTGKWVHVAASYDYNTGNNSLYINGHLKASKRIVRVNFHPNTAQTIRMGSDRYENDHFKGKIADMKVYDVALNEAGIQTSITQGSCTFPVIVLSLPSPKIPLIIETPVID